jgi:Flp pilus assembly protein TadG
MRIRNCAPGAHRRAGGPTGRSGTIVTLLALSMVSLCAFMALAIDIGMLTVAKAQTQNAADLAALTAARTLNGSSTSSTYNNVAATANAQAILSYNAILSQTIQSSQLTLTYGSYDYNQTTQTFSANYPPTTGVAWTAAAATVSSNNLPGAFSRIFGSQFLPNVTCTAQAVHRPRDIALVMDLSGSMSLGTCLGYDFYSATRTCNNPDPLIPTFGHYSSGSANMKGPSTNQVSGADNYTISPSNTTVANSSYTLTYVNSFYQNAAYASTLVRAFDSYSSTDGGTTFTAPTTQTPQLPPTSYATTPGGDAPLFASGSTTTYAQTVNQVLGTTGSPGAANPLWCLDGYAAYVNGQKDTSGTGGIPKVWLQPDYSATPFYGYTQGPGYYGKTFFQWPPDPRNTTTLSGANLATNLPKYLSLIGLTNAYDQAYLVSNWASWQTLGTGPGSFGLNVLQNFLAGAGNTQGGPYTASGPFVPGSNNKAPVYYAVCRLFNWAYPAGSSWSFVTLTSGTSYSADWRVRFFGTSDNTKLFNSSGALNPPGSTGMCSATATYNAILSWLTSSPNPFPTQMRAGRIKYYGSIPTAITGSWPSWGNTDQRFWVEFIDNVLGFNQTAAGSYFDLTGIGGTFGLLGYGQDFAWGTVAINAPPSTPQYMNYNDNPARPRLRFWFGPMMMVDMLTNFNLMENTSPFGYQLGLNWYFKTPGDAYVAPNYNAKQAFVSSVTTMQYNHPNDWFAMMHYSWPRTSATDPIGRQNCVSCPLGINYAYASSSLLFPFSTINADGSCNNTEVTPYDADPATGAVPSANFKDIPRADGDTCFAMGLMLAYNQFAVTPTTDTTLRSYVSSSPIAFPTGMAGGMGRKGAQKVIIFETDGIPNCMATASLVNTGTYSYYKIRYNMNNPTTSEYPTITPLGINDPNVLNQIYTLIQQLASTYGTTRNPFRLYTIGFGPVFSGADASSALSTLQTMQYYAGTQSSASTALPSNQVIIGTGAQMSANMTSAFTTILESGVQIALIQ